MTADRDETGHEPPHASSPTDDLLAELQLFGHRPFDDEPDPRPLPEARTAAGAVADIFDALIATLAHGLLSPAVVLGQAFLDCFAWVRRRLSPASSTR